MMSKCIVCGTETFGRICSSECDNATPAAPSEPVAWHPRGFAAQLRRKLDPLQSGTSPIILDRLTAESIAECLDALAHPAPRVTEAMVEAGLNAMRSCILDSRHPHHESDRKLMRDALTAALAAEASK